VRPPHQEFEVDAAGGDGFAEALRALPAARALVVPMPVGDAPAGLCIVGYEAGTAPPENAVRRHALRIGARCAGRSIEAQRLRDNLERAMAQILLTDERMLGRMGLDIHDGPTQQLSVALLEVQLLEAELADAEEAGLPSPDTLRPALARIYETVGGALHEMRELIGHLRPAQFEDRRLVDVLQDAIIGFEKRTDCEVHATWAGEFPVNGVSITQRITLYRILQETLNNAHRHGHARSVTVHVSEDATGVTLDVRDDGEGFDIDAAQRPRAGMPLARFGLHGMRDRAQILGGSFEITSAPGEGTSVSVFLPSWGGATDASAGAA
jgi:signal transduction histidine kinase